MNEFIHVARTIAAATAFLSAAVFALAGVAALFRFRDAFSRLQGGALCGTTAVFSVFTGALILAPSWSMFFRVLVIMGFFLISSPTGAHIVARFMARHDEDGGTEGGEPAIPENPERETP